MLNFIIIAVIIAIILILCVKLKNKFGASLDEDEDEPDIADAGPLSNVKKGDVLILEGASKDFEDVYLTVNRINIYKSASGSYTWKEFVDTTNGASIEYHEDAEAFITLDVDVEIEDISELGIDEPFLSAADLEKSKSAEFQFNNKTWRYVESGLTSFHKDGKISGEEYWSWDFAATDGSNQTIYIEAWEDEPFSVGMSQTLNAALVQHLPV